MASAASVSESMQMSIILHGQNGHETPLADRTPQKGVGYCKQVMLVMIVCGMEMCMTFEQIYQVLILQYLGVPLSLVSLNGIICGLSSMAIIPFLGFVTDKGSNPKRRKMVSLFVGMVSFQTGIILLLVSGLLKMSLQREVLLTVDAVSASSTQATTVILDAGGEYNRSLMINATGQNGSSIGWSHANGTRTAIDGGTNIGAGMPITAYLAICGFAFVDIGYDSTMPLSRAYILESVPKFQYTRLLVMATLVQATSGTLFSLLGVIDISDALGETFHVDGTSAVLTFLCTLLFIAVTCGFLSTTLTGYFLTKKATYATMETAGVNTASSTPRRKRLISYKPHIHRTDSTDAYKWPLLHDGKPTSTYATINKMSSSTNSNNNEDDCKPRRETDSYKVHRSVSVDSKPSGEARQSSYSMAVPELDESSLQGDTSLVASSESKKPNEDSNPRSEATNPITEMSVKQSHSKGDGGKARMKKKLIILSCSTFFTFGASISFLYYAANAVTLGIYHGDPSALPGSEGKHLYDRGLRTAALGNLSFYILFTITSLVNNKLMHIAGEKLLFVIFHLVFILPLIALMSTRSLEAYFVTIVMVGIFRHTVYTLPFVMVNQITQDTEENNTSDVSQSNLGKTMSLIGFLIPAHYIIISAIMGPVFEATGDVWVPLMYSLGCACLSVLIFCLMFLVK